METSLHQYLIPAKCRTHTGEHRACNLYVTTVDQFLVLHLYEVKDTCAVALDEFVASNLLATFPDVDSDEDILLEPHRLRNTDPVNGCVIMLDKGSAVWLSQLLGAWLAGEPLGGGSAAAGVSTDLIRK
jgi:hypothetical protein